MKKKLPSVNDGKFAEQCEHIFEMAKKYNLGLGIATFGRRVKPILFDRTQQEFLSKADVDARIKKAKEVFSYDGLLLATAIDELCTGGQGGILSDPSIRKQKIVDRFPLIQYTIHAIIEKIASNDLSNINSYELSKELFEQFLQQDIKYKGKSILDNESEKFIQTIIESDAFLVLMNVKLKSISRQILEINRVQQVYDNPNYVPNTKEKKKIRCQTVELFIADTDPLTTTSNA